MSGPTLHQHETRLALLERGAAHDAEHDKAVLDKLDKITDEITSLRSYVEQEVKVIADRQNKTETRVNTVLGNVRAFGAGMAAAFTLIGTALGAGLSSFLEWFK
jgi:hypothetical protein